MGGKNQDNVEKNIADLLEDDVEPKKSIPAKESQNDLYSSDDDFMFRPVPNRRNKKKQKQKAAELEEDYSRCQGDSSAADSESEKFAELDNMKLSSKKSKNSGKESKDGWSFEMDEEDVNKLLEKESMREPSEKEERTALEDVFRFDSEMRDEESSKPESNVHENVGGKC